VNHIHTVTCMGYCLIEPIYNDSNIKEITISLAWSTSDIAEKQGWTTSSNHKFSLDGKTIVWLCPKCSMRWKEERQVRIDEIMKLAIRDMNERQFWNLINELYSLSATKEEKDKFSSLLFPVRVK